MVGQAKAENWVQVGATDLADMYLDTDGVYNPKTGIDTIRLKQEFYDKTQSGDYAVATFDFKCKTKEARMTSVVVWSVTHESRELKLTEDETKWSDATGSNIFGLVCSKSHPYLSR